MPDINYAARNKVCERLRQLWQDAKKTEPDEALIGDAVDASKSIDPHDYTGVATGRPDGFGPIGGM